LFGGVTKKTDFLCSYCNPDKSKNRKSKENRVRDLLTEHNIQFIQDKVIENDCCLKYRPDFLIDCGTYYIILECDENAHAQYEQECEIIRMNNISSGLGLPVKFIRYNPDQKNVTRKEKERVLIDTLHQHYKKELITDLDVKYLY
jgi:molybdenum cofactor biosynthesis enzyme MoaA